MSISYLLVFLGLAAFGGAVWALFWAVDAGQYDDLEAQGRAILDEPSPQTPPHQRVQHAADEQRAEQ